MYRIEDVDLELEKLIVTEGASLRAKYIANIEQQESMLSSTVKSIDHARNKEFGSTVQIWNIAGFVITVSLDVKTIGMHLTFATNEWAKRFFMRQLSLIVYESINDLFDLLGKDFRSTIKTDHSMTELELEFNRIRKELNAFKGKYYAYIKRVRNVATAHRDQNVMEQLNEIFSLSWKENIEMMTSYDRILNSLGSVLQKTIDSDIERLRNMQI